MPHRMTPPEDFEFPKILVCHTRDELWLEFKKTIDAGNIPFGAFKTKAEMNRHIDNLIRKKPGNSLRFLFLDKEFRRREFSLEITKKDIHSSASREGRAKKAKI